MSVCSSCFLYQLKTNCLAERLAMPLGEFRNPSFLNVREVCNNLRFFTSLIICYGR